MMGDGAWAWWGPGVLLMVFCMVMMVWMMGGHGGHGSHGRGDDESSESSGHSSSSAERILADRLARGEIDVEEYERRLRVLRQSGDLDRT